MALWKFDPPTVTPLVSNNYPPMQKDERPMMTPIDIEMKKFHSTKRLKDGYDQNEVDAFLVEVAEDYKAMQLNINQLEAKVGGWDKDATSEIPVYKEAVGTPPAWLKQDDRKYDEISAVDSELGTVSKLLTAAQKTAEIIEADARAQADLILMNATNQSRVILSGAYTDRDAKLLELHQQEDALRARIAELDSTKTQYEGWLKLALASVQEAPNAG